MTRASLLPRCSVPSIGSPGSSSSSSTPSPAAPGSSRRREVSAPSSSTSPGVTVVADALSQHLVIDAVLGGGLGAVHVEPPVADEVLLVEDGPVGTEEAVGDEAAVSVPQGAEVEHLALGVRVCVLATLGLSSSNINMGRSV